MPVPALISIVDDDPSFRDSLRRLLRSHGYAVAAFASAAEFLASSKRPATTCLVADIQMPSMTGVELYVHLSTTGSAIPTILVTAHPEERTRMLALRSGVTCYLLKPLDESALMDCVRQAASRRGAGGVP